MPHRPSIDERQSFAFELGHLARTVTTRGGRAYCHRCSLASYRAVARSIAENAGEGVTTNMLWESLPEVPCTQAAIAAAFLKQRGCVVVQQRRMFPASNFLFEDAMIEWHALAHDASGAANSDSGGEGT